jgi:hypothetical protein
LSKTSNDNAGVSFRSSRKRLVTGFLPEIQSDVKGFGGAVPAIDASATVKIGRDSNVIDTDQANGVIDMVGRQRR